jgi:hypothetical protein
MGLKRATVCITAPWCDVGPGAFAVTQSAKIICVFKKTKDSLSYL